MVRFVRAAVVAVAGLSLALGATFAQPTQAEEAVSASSISYTEHGLAAPKVDAVAVAPLNNGLPLTGAASDTLAAPVAPHALETLQPAAPAAEEKAEPKSLSELVAEHASGEAVDAELECLATAVYYESKSEPLAGQLAVAEVILNRAQSGRFPATVCGVVKQRGQFSFVRGGRLPSVNKSNALWQRAVAISHIARHELSESKASNALFFHARRVSPGWRLTRVGIVGNHVFYR